jgi:hypothetical protein
MPSDHFGALRFPAQIPGPKDSVHDPALDCIAAYLSACLNDQLGASWQAVNPGRKFVESFTTNGPGDEFNERLLPALFVWRSGSIDEPATDDWLETVTDVSVTWVPQNAVQAKRGIRSTGVNGFHKVVSRALALGRSPAWVDPSDTDPTSKTLGSVLITRAELFRWPFVTMSKMDQVTIQKGTLVDVYPAFTVMIKIHEITKWDESFDSISMTDRAVSKLDNTTTSGGFNISELIPTT